MALNKRAALIAKARATVRTPKKPTETPTQLGRHKGYRIVAVSLYTPEADWIDQVTRALQLAGSPKANRSLVVREAILRLKEQLEGKSPKEVLLDFAEQQAQRF